MIVVTRAAHMQYFLRATFTSTFLLKEEIAITVKCSISLLNWKGDLSNTLTNVLQEKLRLFFQSLGHL